MRVTEANATINKRSRTMGTPIGRIRKGGVVIELGANQMEVLKISHRNKIIQLLRQKGYWATVNYELYKRGSAFLRN